MAGIVYSGTITIGVTLNDPATQGTATVLGTISKVDGDAIFGTTAFPWNVINQGTIQSTGTTGDGIQLVQGGTVNNKLATSLIEGYGEGVLIKGAAGSVTNMGTIEAIGTDSDGVKFTEGGKVVNGNASATSSLISGVRHGVLIQNAIGTVSNFGTISNTGTRATIALTAGGTVANGTNLSTAALITGGGTGIYVNNGTGVVTNFGGIAGTTGVFLRHGGTVTNGSASLITATITGSSGNAVLVSGSAGTVTNFGTINATGTHAGVSVIDGGKVTNGSASVTGALITANGTGVYLHQAGTVINFGTIADTSTLGGNGVAFEYGGTLINSGTITNAHSSNSVVYLGGGGSVINSNNGSIIGLISGSGTGITARGGAGAVTNYGSVQSTGTSFSGIYLGAGGSITNKVGGLISGLSSAISIRGAAGTVINAGSVRSTGTSFNGVYLGAGGSITNQIGGLISGGSTAIFVRAAGTVINAGSVQGTATFANAIYLGAGGSISNSGVLSEVSTAIVVRGGAGTISNSGSVQASGSAGNAIYLGAGGSVTNSGLVSASANTAIVIRRAAGTVINSGSVRSTGAFGNAVYMGAGGSVTNQTGGLVSAVNTAILSRGGAGTVTNTGTIQSSTASGVYLTFGGSLTNQAGGLITGAQNGIYTRNFATSVVNFGTVSNTGTGPANAIYLRGGGSIVNNAGGTLAGNAAGIVSSRQGGTVTNFGVISGTVGVLGTTSGSLTLTNSGTISSSAGTAGTAIQLGNSVGHNLLVVKAGSKITGAVNGGGTAEVDFVQGGVNDMNNVNDPYSGFTTIGLGNGVSHSLTLSDANFANISGSRITVIGGDSGNTVNAVTNVLDSTHAVTFVGGAGTDVLKGGAGSDIFQFSTTTLTGADVVQGNGGFDDRLVMTSAGTVTVTGLSGVEIIELADGGANTLALTDANFTGVSGGFIRVYGGSSGNTVDGSGVTTAANHQLVMYGGSGIDSFTGGAGNDVFVFTAANLSAGDTVAGGGGNDYLLMTTAGTINADNVSGVENFVLASNGANTFTFNVGNFTGVTGSTIQVVGGAAGNTVDVTPLPAADRLVFIGGAGADHVTGGEGSDVFKFAAGDLTAADTINGTSSLDDADQLILTTAGTINAGGVSGVETIALSGSGANTLVLGNGNFSGVTGALIHVIGGAAGNTVDASALSAANSVTINGGAGADLFVFSAANLTGGDTLVGGGGADQLSLTTAGTINVSGVSGVETIGLAGTGANTLVLGDSNYTGVTGASIKVNGGAAGNTVDASGLTGAHKLVFVGGAGADNIFAGPMTTMTGGGGANQFTFDDIGTNSITDFGLVGASNALVLRDAGFNLGANEGGGTGSPQHLDASVFVASATGAFTNTNQRFAYNTLTGKLNYDADGNGAAFTAHAVTVLADHATLTAGGAGNVFFI